MADAHQQDAQADEVPEIAEEIVKNILNRFHVSPPLK
jgi:hypothetical protein